MTALIYIHVHILLRVSRDLAMSISIFQKNATKMINILVLVNYIVYQYMKPHSKYLVGEMKKKSNNL